MQLKKALILLTAVVLTPFAQAAESCITQSQMQPADRDSLAAAATNLAGKVQANDQTGLRALTIAEYQKNFSSLGDIVLNTSARIKGATPEVEQLYVLDASTLAAGANGANPDAQFYCTLNKSQAEADFTIPQLPPGKYAFAMVRMESAKPWRVSLLLRQEGGTWHLAGLYPKPLTAAGHDGLWYWQQARALKAQKQPWSAWLYLQEAQSLVQPAGFVSSSHLEKLATELTETTPPALTGSLTAEAPFVLKAADGAEYRFTSIAVDDSLGNDKVDVAAHLKIDTLGDAAAARKRNLDAMAALVAAHPELRQSFHGVWIFAEPATGSPYATEQAMADIH